MPAAFGLPPGPTGPDGPAGQNRCRMLSGGQPANANLPFLVHHWLMTHAEAGTFRLLVASGGR